MAKQRISVGDIQVGQPLPWAVFDTNGKLLLREGYVIATESQLDRLIEQGMFVEDDSRGKKFHVVQGDTEPPSVYRLLTDARSQLAYIAQNFKSAGFEAPPPQSNGHYPTGQTSLQRQQGRRLGNGAVEAGR